MSRPVTMRPHYRTDAAFLLRLEGAVAVDTRQTDRWREETAAMCRALSVRLLGATGTKNLPASSGKTRG